jgi:predicted GNAT family acetyltransferase
MPEVDSPVTVVDNPAKNRYEARIGDELAGFVVYRFRPGVMVLVHTEVDPAFGGHGVGGRLAAAALEDIRNRGLTVDPVCPFITSYLERHPQFADLVARPASSSER